MFRKIIFIFLSTAMFISVANAAEIGPFIGGSIGTSTIYTPSDFAFAITPDLVIGETAEVKRDPSGFAWRLAAGYNFTKYMGAEFDYFQPAESKYTATNGGFNAKLTYNDNIGELLLDGYLPMSQKFNWYGKVGLAYIRQKVSYQNDSSTFIPINTDDFSENLQSGTFSALAPVVALGFNFHLTPKLSSDVDYNYIYSYSSDDFKDKESAVASVGYFAVGLRYNF